jgi:hypothetical protein
MMLESNGDGDAELDAQRPEEGDAPCPSSGVTVVLQWNNSGRTYV